MRQPTYWFVMHSKYLGRRKPWRRKLSLLSRGATRAGWESLIGNHQQGFKWAMGKARLEREVRGSLQERKKSVTAGWPQLNWEQGQRPGPPGGWATAAGTSSRLKERSISRDVTFLPKVRGQVEPTGWSGRLDGHQAFFSCTIKAVGTQDARQEGSMELWLQKGWDNWNVFIRNTLWDKWLYEIVGNLATTHSIISILKWVVYPKQPM